MIGREMSRDSCPTSSEYAVYFKKMGFILSCTENSFTFPPFESRIGVFYTHNSIYHTPVSTLPGLPYHVFLTINNHPVEKHPLVCRFLKGAFEKKPPPNRHYTIWDVKTVLAYLKTFTPNSSLNLKEISHKLVMLLK